MRSMSVVLGVTAVTAAALSGCSSSPDYNAVCIEEESQQRVSDSDCDNDSYGSTYRWYYIGSGQRIPSVGSRVYGGSTVEPAGSVARGGQSSSGDSYTDSGNSSRDYGGFGGSGSGISS
jgi:hypothetical protein